MRWISGMLFALLLVASGCADPVEQGRDADDWGLQDAGADTTAPPDTDTPTPDTDIPRDTATPPDTDVPPDTTTPGDTDTPPDTADADTGSPDTAPPPDAGCKMPVPDEHRPAPQTCEGNPPSGEVMVGSTGQNECESHDDCSGLNARCVRSRIGYVCTKDECLTDSDCGEGAVCECGGGRHGSNTCLPSECQTDADCGPNSYCSGSFGTCGSYSGNVGYFCHTCEDECTDDADCGGGSGYTSPYCMFDQQVGKWTCSSSHCAG